MLSDIFSMWVKHDELQIDFEFHSALLIFTEITALNLEIFAEIIVFRIFFFKVLWEIELIFGMRVLHHKLQLKCEFLYTPLIFTEVTAIGLWKIRYCDTCDR